MAKTDFLLGVCMSMLSPEQKRQLAEAAKNFDGNADMHSASGWTKN